jgi:hypothetical protein
MEKDPNVTWLIHTIPSEMDIISNERTVAGAEVSWNVQSEKLRKGEVGGGEERKMQLGLAENVRGMEKVRFPNLRFPPFVINSEVDERRGLKTNEEYACVEEIISNFVKVEGESRGEEEAMTILSPADPSR